MSGNFVITLLEYLNTLSPERRGEEKRGEERRGEERRGEERRGGNMWDTGLLAWAFAKLLTVLLLYCWDCVESLWHTIHLVIWPFQMTVLLLLLRCALWGCTGLSNCGLDICFLLKQLNRWIIQYKLFHPSQKPLECTTGSLLDSSGKNW